MLPGIEGSEGITALALSPSKKYLAVCEKAERAICGVVDISNLNTVLKRKRILTSMDYACKSFISCAFAPVGYDKSYLVTLSGVEDDPRVIIWTWDKGKCYAQQ